MMLLREARVIASVVLFCAFPIRVEGDSSLSILSELKSIRTGGLALLEGISAGLDKVGKTEESQEVKKWSDDWLSILGISKGLTGLAKDFAFNYLGRSAYHDKNGPLLDAIKKAGQAYPGKDSKVDKKRLAAVRQSILKICVEGRKLFERDGSIFVMLDELQTILNKDEIAKQFDLAVVENPEVRKAFDFLTGPAPDVDEDEEL
mmetsp:Transcript_77035/g.121633  ORF Transcript_77035/g.121633 Transcript_77035/m.121633 type:complete len:204 (+) Transcript_77035:80-691(+)